MSSSLKHTTDNGHAAQEAARRRALDAALFSGRPCPSSEFEPRREALREQFSALMEDFMQNNPRKFLTGLRGHRSGYIRERDGVSRVMDLVDDIDALASEEVWVVLQLDGGEGTVVEVDELCELCEVCGSPLSMHASGIHPVKEWIPTIEPAGRGSDPAMLGVVSDSGSETAAVSPKGCDTASHTEAEDGPEPEAALTESKEN